MKFKLKKFNIELIGKPTPKLNILLKKFDLVRQGDLAGVYEIPYITEKGDLNYYKSMTGRKFGIRKGEHELDIKFGRTKNALSRLYLDGMIKILFNESKLCSVSNFYRKSIIRES